jgi:hypothetical protein
MKTVHRLSCLAILLGLAGTISPQSGGSFMLTQSVIANGGGISSGGIYNISGTVGQSLAGTSSSGSAFNVASGFWSDSFASSLTVSGRVTTSEGRGVRNARVTITDNQNLTRQVLTGRYGSYRFENVAPGQTYDIGVMSRRFQFTSQTVAVNNNSLSGVDFTALP